MITRADLQEVIEVYRQVFQERPTKQGEERLKRFEALFNLFEERQAWRKESNGQ